MPKGVYQRKPVTNEARANMRLAQLGRKHSEETKRKIRIGNIGLVKARGEKNVHWKGDFTMDHGYVGVTMEDGVRRMEHRLVMETKMGRKLLKKEIIHHWNEKTTDNRPENLGFFRGVAAHLRIHRFALRHGLNVEELKFEQPWLFNRE